VVKNRLEVGHRIACLAWIGALAHMMRTRRLHARLCVSFGKAFGARPQPATITYNAKASELAARQMVLFCEKMNLDP
jgi:IS4 transposase